MSTFSPHPIIWTSEKIRRLFDYYATYYDNSFFSTQFGRSIARYVSKHISIYDKSILDFGCGTGKFLEILSEFGPKKLLGIEITDSENNKIVKWGGVGEFFYVKDLPSPISDSSVDICFLIEVIEHLTDEVLENTIKEIKRVIKPGGYLIVTTPNDENLQNETTICPECGCVFHRWQHVRSWNISSIKTYLTDMGFDVIYVKALKWIPSDVSILTKVMYSYINSLKSIMKRKMPHLVCICQLRR